MHLLHTLTEYRFKYQVEYRCKYQVMNLSHSTWIGYFFYNTNNARINTKMVLFELLELIQVV